MNSVRRQFFLATCLLIVVSVCPLTSAASGSTSLWGEKLQFIGPPCLWQLQPTVVVPAMRELSACMLLRHSVKTNWTGFVYKAPQVEDIELGLGGTSSKLTAWLFGRKYQFTKELKVNEWYTICLTWSDQDQKLRIYVNGLVLEETTLSSGDGLHHQLAQNGTLTLGVSHIVQSNGDLRPESGNKLLGEIGVFRMWGRQWSAEELNRLGCADGDVVSWDLQQWKYGCPPKPDNNLYCGNYSVNCFCCIL